MQRTMVNASNCGRFRNRFLFWSFSVSVSLISSGLVPVGPTSAMAQDGVQAGGEAAGAEAATVSPPREFDRKAFNNLLSSGQLEEAASSIDAALAENPNDISLLQMSITLARMNFGKDIAGAEKRLDAATETVMGMERLSPAAASILSSSALYLVQLRSKAPLEERVALLDRYLNKLNEASDTSLASSIQTITSVKARLMMTEGNKEEAKAFMDKIAQAEFDKIDPNDRRSVLNLIGFANNYNSLVSVEFPDAAKEMSSKVESIALNMLNKEKIEVGDFTPLYTLKAAEIRSLGYSDPKGGEAVLADLETRFKTLQEQLGEDGGRELQMLEKNMSSLRSGLEPALKREKLIGQLAPEIEAEHFIASEPITMADLKGKVVLIDFWAVWCGPCIATFPHLIEWHEQFSDQGLVILGATRFYDYEWDEEKGKAARGNEVSEETELAMLEKFRESHKLHHGFFVSPKTSNYSKQFEVTGIPQAVLIDKEGKIQLIRVGSGAANAKAMHEKIVELLAQ